MANVIPFPDDRARAYRQTASLIASTVEELEDVLVGLTALRSLGECAESAIAAVLDVPEVKQLRLSWELLEALMLGEGLEPEPVLESVLDPDWREYARAALLGDAA